MRIGIVGAGLMGSWHARAAEKAGGRVSAITDIDEKSGRLLAAQYPAAHFFSSSAEMLRQQSIDVLHLCTPTNSHYKITELAASAGVNLCVEKPLAESAAETIKLYELAEKTGVRICPTHQFVFQRSVEIAKKKLPYLGRIIHLQATICSAGGKRSENENLTEIAIDIVPHALSLFQAFLSDLLVEENFNSWSSKKGELCIRGWADDVSLTVFISLNARPTVNSFQIFAEKGTIHLDLFHDYIFTEPGKTSKLRKILRPFDLSTRNFSAAFFNLMRRTARFETAYPGLQNLITRFYQSIRENTQPPISAAQTINIARIRDKLISSTEEKKIN